MRGAWHAILRAMLVVARRDFLSVVATPGFLLFLLGPLLMFGMVLLGAVGGAQFFEESRDTTRIVALVPTEEAQAITDVDKRMRRVMAQNFPSLEVRSTTLADITPQRAKQIFDEVGSDTHAVLLGPINRLAIYKIREDKKVVDYLQLLAQNLPQTRTATPMIPTVDIAVAGAQIQRPSYEKRQHVASQTMMVLFLLVILIAGQSVGMLAEEKGNKIIEILAAAVPLESVFFGKLLGLLGVAFVFIAFWSMALVIGGGVMEFATDSSVALTPEAGNASLAIAAGEDAAETFFRYAPATGWSFFLMVCLGYFVMLFLLLGSLFLGVGALAGSVREIQMLSLPVTIFQVAMLSLSLAGASDMDSPLGIFAQLFPFSSPFTMAARAATDEAVAIHFIALSWQGFWVGIVIFLSARLFRANVLSGGSGFYLWKRR